VVARMLVRSIFKMLKKGLEFDPGAPAPAMATIG
jgi:hypothetical protein